MSADTIASIDGAYPDKDTSDEAMGWSAALSATNSRLAAQAPETEGKAATP